MRGRAGVSAAACVPVNTAAHFNGRDRTRNCGHLCARQVLAGSVPHHTRHETLLIWRRVEDLKLRAAADEITLQPVLEAEVRHIARRDRLNLRRRYLDRGTGHRGLTIRRHLE